jgi:TolB-like protein/AraC-like DNA-binding protein/Tfp pilus assembly protein PilF
MVPEPNDQTSFSARLRDTIDRHLNDEGFGVAKLAQEMGMSHSTLRRKVKSLAGTSISNYICKLRLEKAVEILTSGSLPVSEVAFSCGFQSVSYFVRCFKKMYRTTPGQFRKEHATQHAAEGTNYPIESGLSRKLEGRRGLIILSMMAAMLIITISLLFKLTSPAAQDRSANASIAVLPFRNLNPDEAEMYFINGTMEAILNHLQQIEDLRVPGRTTMEQYRNTPKNIREIARELNVSYVLEGSGQKSGNRVRLSITLVDAVNDQQIWSDYYDKEILTVEEIFGIQSDIAHQVAQNIKVVIKPEEREQIERIPTKSLNAYYYFQMGREEHNKFIYRGNIHAIENAIRFYCRALECDSMFAPPYCWLAYTYLHRRTYLEDLYDDSSDSALILADIALSIDDRIAEPYLIRGWYYFQAGDFNRALKESDRAEKLEPGSQHLYNLRAWSYWGTDLSRSVENFQRMLECSDGQPIPYVYKNLGNLYHYAGYPRQSEYYFREAFNLNGDTLALYNGLARIAFSDNLYPEAIELGLRGYAVDTLDPNILEILAFSYMFNRQPDRAAEYFEKCLESPETLMERYYLILGPAGYTYWMTGKREQAEILFSEQIKHASRIIEKDLPFEKAESFYRLAAIHSLREDTAQALSYLRSFSQDPFMVFYRPTMLNHDPSFDNLRNHPEFQQIRQDIEDWYQREQAGIGNSFQYHQ